MIPERGGNVENAIPLHFGTEATGGEQKVNTVGDPKVEEGCMGGGHGRGWNGQASALKKGVEKVDRHLE